MREDLEALISPEAVKLLEDYMESYIAMQAMEDGTTFMCGLTVHSAISRCFDASTPEYKSFASEYL